MTWDSENIINVEFPKVLQEIEKFLKPTDNGFELVSVGAVPNTLPSILYQSKQCKLRIQSLRDRSYEDIEIYVYYGRLHAPLDKDVIDWNNEKCYCWHSLEWDPVLNFLDGISPTEIVNRNYESPRAIKEFSESTKDIRYKEEIAALTGKGGNFWSRAEFFSKKHAFLWKYYGQRLFDLFDLNRPDLWKEYRDYLKEYYKLYHKKATQKPYPYDPPKHQVC